MKKENQSIKKNRTMATKSVPKNIQPILSAITDYIVKIVVDVTNEDDIEENLRQVMEDNKDDLIKIIKNNMPTQKDSSAKKVKDSDAPKRCKSSYIYFCVEKRDKIKNDNPDMSAKEIIKELGRVWREDVSDKDKERYTKMSVDDKSRYENEMKDYTPSNVTGGVVKKVKSKGPKRGLTSYIFFCKEQRSLLKEEDSNLETKEITSELGKRWRELSEKDRKPFEKLAAKDKDRYEKEKAELLESNPNSNSNLSSSEKEPASKKKKKSSKKEDSKNSRKSGYILYCQEVRPTLKVNKDLTSQQITKELGRKWKELSEHDQKSYNERSGTSVKSEKKSEKKSVKKSVKKVVKKAESEELDELDDEDNSD
jgi:high mobility group protein B2